MIFFIIVMEFERSPVNFTLNSLPWSRLFLLSDHGEHIVNMQPLDSGSPPQMS